ncbi:hypothetical protein LCGC14_2111760, partial [marine sediment metagenome]
MRKVKSALQRRLLKWLIPRGTMVTHFPLKCKSKQGKTDDDVSLLIAMYILEYEDSAKMKNSYIPPFYSV